MPTVEEMRKYREKYEKEHEEFKQYLDELRQKELEEKGITPIDVNQVPEKHCDHPNTMENSTATILWLIVMGVGALFNDAWIIWIIATVIWLKFITRHKK